MHPHNSRPREDRSNFNQNLHASERNERFERNERNERNDRFGSPEGTGQSYSAGYHASDRAAPMSSQDYVPGMNSSDKMDAARSESVPKSEIVGTHLTNERTSGSSTHKRLNA